MKQTSQQMLSGRSPRTVAYVMTHYPMPSQTFLMEEILGVERHGVRVLPIAINGIDDADLLTDRHRSESARTHYVKLASRAMIVATFARLGLRHPVRLIRFLGGAALSGGPNLSLGLRRLFHAVEGVLVWSHCSNQGADHLHAQFGGMPASVAMYAARCAREVFDRDEVTWSYTVHGFHDFVDEESIRLDLKTQDASFVVGISAYTCAQLMRLSPPAAWPKIHLVRCGIDVGRFAFLGARPATEKARVVMVGRISPEKGHGIAVDALAALRDAGHQVELRFVGNGPFEPEIRAQIERLGLTGDVVFCGLLAADGVRSELAQADVFCLPSFAEGVPVSIMEALAIGVPVVSTSVGGIPELITDGVSGRCVSPGRADELAEAIASLLTGNELREAVVAEGRRRVCELHDTSVASAAMAELLLSARPIEQ